MVGGVAHFFAVVCALSLLWIAAMYFPGDQP